MSQIETIKKEISNFSKEENLFFDKMAESLSLDDLNACKIRYVSDRNRYNKEKMKANKENLITTTITLALCLLAYFSMLYFVDDFKFGFNILVFIIFGLLIPQPLIDAKHLLRKPKVETSTFNLLANKSVKSEHYYNDLKLAKEL